MISASVLGTARLTDVKERHVHTYRKQTQWLITADTGPVTEGPDNRDVTMTYRDVTATVIPLVRGIMSWVMMVVTVTVTVCNRVAATTAAHSQTLDVGSGDAARRALGSLPGFCAGLEPSGWDGSVVFVGISAACTYPVLCMVRTFMVDCCGGLVDEAGT
jgi:hypothetical protein